jgi:hypothetical protein
MGLFNEEQRAQWTHRLGNLVLLNRTKNAEAQNYDFSKKKDKYFTSPSGVPTFALTTQVLHTPEWTPDLVKERHGRLVDSLVKEWDL